MSQLSRGIFGAIAISLSLGAAQLASGRDLGGEAQGSLAASAVTPVNRAAKTDRAAPVAAAVQSRTVALRLDDLADTSILVRIPLVKQARSVPVVPTLAKSADRKVKEACEPVVSVLTEIARQLQPGRCVT